MDLMMKRMKVERGRLEFFETRIYRLPPSQLRFSKLSHSLLAAFPAAQFC